MASTPATAGEREAGAPIPKDAIDPDLVRLKRTRARIGVITALGVLLLCGYFVVALGPDRHFGGQPEKARAVALSDITLGHVTVDDHVELAAEPMFARAIRSYKNKGDVGIRLVPVQKSGDRVWLALPGDGWDDPVIDGRYRGRLRELASVTFAASVRDFSATNPTPVFARVTELRAALAGGKLKTVTDEELTVADGDRVAWDLVEPAKSTIISVIGERHPTREVWLAAFTRAGFAPGDITIATPHEQDEAYGQLRFDAKVAVAEATKKLADAELFATRVQSVTTHHETTWGELKKQGADARVDLVGVYAKREIPEDAYILLTNEVPQEYWYVTPISIVLGIIGLLFAWALVRAVRRDVLPARA